ncbi:MAG: class II aldolase/adducin family protein [Microthrixaceae bacterium]
MTATDLSHNPMAPPLPELSPQAEVALLCRTLFREGYDDHLAGHITYRQPDGTLLVNPWGLTWDEVRASDVLRIDTDGNLLEGRWTVTPAIPLHVELHRARPDVAVAVHNHPRWGTIWADLRRVPPVYDQTSAMVPGDPALYADFDGSVDRVANARACVEALGDARTALLANHGVFVVGADVAQAHHRAVVLEWRCRQAWHVEALGGGVPVDPEVFRRFAAPFDHVSFPGLWEAMCRRELRHDPSITD